MNHKANTKAALRWLSQEKDVPEYGAQLAPEWEQLRAKVEDNVDRSRLSPLMRYCSAKGIAPDAVEETVIDAFMEYRARSTARPVERGDTTAARKGLECKCRHHRELARSASSRTAGPSRVPSRSGASFRRGCALTLSVISRD